MIVPIARTCRRVRSDPAKECLDCSVRSCRFHAVVPVDLFVQGCPPSADTIWHVLTELMAGRVPDTTSVTRFGA